MIVFAALTPHSPLLLPSINKDRLKEVEQTRAAMNELRDLLYASRPDTLIIFSSHATQYDDAFSINLHDEYNVDLKSFGDLGDYRTFKPDLQTIDRLQRALRRDDQKLTLSSDAHLDYGAAIPLLLLTENLPNVQIVPIAYSSLSAKEHFQFGDALKEILMNENKRIAVIATGDGSHALTSHSPAGFSKEGKQFDEAVQTCIAARNTAGLLTLDPNKVAKAHECAYRPLLMLLGVLDRMNYRGVIDSYEAPFGVGYLVTHFELA